jgi:hypothetical protein
MRNEIVTILNATIKSDYYDNIILDSLDGFKYRLYGDSTDREECFIRYTQADTTYVISGWLREFISFYRAVPGIINYDLKELQREVLKISSVDIEIPKKDFEASPKDNPYFVEYVDMDKMTRIRCYHISEVKILNEEKKTINTPFTLIEITRFLDKEVMP